MRISFYESAGDFRGKFLQLVSIGEVQDDKVHVEVSDGYWGAKATLPDYYVRWFRNKKFQPGDIFEIQMANLTPEKNLDLELLEWIGRPTQPMTYPVPVHLADRSRECFISRKKIINESSGKDYDPYNLGLPPIVITPHNEESGQVGEVVINDPLMKKIDIDKLVPDQMDATILARARRMSSIRDHSYFVPNGFQKDASKAVWKIRQEAFFQSTDRAKRCMEQYSVTMNFNPEFQYSFTCTCTYFIFAKQANNTSGENTLVAPGKLACKHIAYVILQ